MTLLLIIFTVCAGIVWLSTFGYALVLRLCVPRQPDSGIRGVSQPRIALVIPVLNEESLIQAKLQNIREADYPPDQMEVLIVDGGSVDRTAEIVLQGASTDRRIRTLILHGTNGQSDQITRALGLVKQEIVVITDADSSLHPACVSELVRVIQEDPQTAVVGATVEPRSVLPEERLHWWLVNLLWWMEGEVLSAAHLSGVCYACRRDAVLPFSGEAHAADIHVSLASSARGFRARICRTARAEELRVPQTLQELMQCRRRRGAGYLSELMRAGSDGPAPVRWRIARSMRLWHFRGIPKMATGLILMGSILLFTPCRRVPLYALACFVLPVVMAPFFSPVLAGEKNRWIRLPLAALRYSVFTLISMLNLKPTPDSRRGEGGIS